MIFLFRVVISLSCPIQCCFVALHDYDHYARLPWIGLAHVHGRFPVFCYPSSSTKRNSACASTHPFLNPVIPYESTIPTYIWYLLAIPNEDFHVPSQNLIQKFPFCNRTSSWCGEGKSISFMSKIFDGSFNY